jgi:hypothetical protein
MHLRASYTPRRFGIAVNVHGDSSVLGLSVKHFFRFEIVTGLLSEALKRFCRLFLQGIPSSVRDASPFETWASEVTSR